MARATGLSIVAAAALASASSSCEFGEYCNASLNDAPSDFIALAPGEVREVRLQLDVSAAQSVLASEYEWSLSLLVSPRFRGGPDPSARVLYSVALADGTSVLVDRLHHVVGPQDEPARLGRIELAACPADDSPCLEELFITVTRADDDDDSVELEISLEAGFAGFRHMPELGDKCPPPPLLFEQTWET